MSAITSKKHYYIIITHIIRKEDDTFVAICPEFDIASQGKTVEEADNNLKDAVLLYLQGIKELGTREQIFREKKIRIYHRLPKVKKENIFISKDFNNTPFITTQSISVAC